MTLSSTVSVSLGERSYKILIQAGLLGRLEGRLSELAVTGKAGVVTDRHVASHYLSGMLRQLKQYGVDAVPIVLPPGERSKKLDTITHILDVMARHRFERSSLLFALGGGVSGI